MKKVILILILIFSGTLTAQYEERVKQLTELNVKEYTRPFVTSLGTAMNSGGYYTAKIPGLFGFSFSIKGMVMLIPEEQKTFIPILPDGYNTGPTATIYGGEGSSYFGLFGEITMPQGADLSAVPFVYPQISASLLGTEVLLRYLPEIDLTTGSDNKISLFGIGAAHSISQYIPLFPIDIAVQVMYNKMEVTDLFTVKNIAVNVHVSKTIGIFTPYFGLQYENTKVNLDYTYNGNDPNNPNGTRISTEIEGDNNFRGTIGASLSLIVLTLNADFSLSSQPVATGGVTFAF